MCYLAQPHRDTCIRATQQAGDSTTLYLSPADCHATDRPRRPRGRNDNLGSQFQVNGGSPSPPVVPQAGKYLLSDAGYRGYWPGSVGAPARIGTHSAPRRNQRRPVPPASRSAIRQSCARACFARQPLSQSAIRSGSHLRSTQPFRPTSGEMRRLVDRGYRGRSGSF